MKFGYLNMVNGAGPVQGNISKYPGSWPKVVIKYLKDNGFMIGRILEPYAGRSNLNTIKIDLSYELQPDIIGVAQKLPFRNSSFDSAILDPPYNNMYSESLYKVKAPDIKEGLKEAARCTRSGGFVSMLCFKNMAAPKSLVPEQKIFVNLGPDRHVRCLNIWKVV